MTTYEREEYNNLLASTVAIVVENGRVLKAAENDLLFDVDSLIAEVEFECDEIGLPDEDKADVVAYALAHYRHN